MLKMLKDLKATMNEERNRRHKNQMEHLEKENTTCETKNSLDGKS